MAYFEELIASKLKMATNGVPRLDGDTAAAPTSGTVAAVHEQVGPFVRSTFTLTAARVPVTDDGANGSYGTLKLYTFPAGGISYLGSRQNYTAFAEGSVLTGGAGDAAFAIGLGSAAIAGAGNGVLTGSATYTNIGSAISVTLSGGTGTGTAHTGAGTAIDGTSTDATLNLNWAGSAASIDGSSTIDVTGTITVLWAHLKDD